ncbi:phosphate metabolism protein 7 [Coniosporium apollinis]|uniref:Phosphate metabolism protein 7 n=1 Tax=Coniosporium apollinis TaxID=61459 RepID=A0ABQ9NZS5_9PEZI|nr:phosphate metabolism protein 7 [Coniosporium apollinis]
MESLQHVITLQKNPNEGSHRNSPSSAAAFFATLIPSLVQFAVLVTAFLVLRRKERRVYAPRTYIDSIPDDEKTPIPDHTFVGWIRKFRDVDDEYILNHHSLDGYLLIRFFKVVIGICFVGCCITWPILLPVNATGGGGEKQFNRVAFGNVRDPARYFAHALIAWVFLGFVMFTITRETIYLINLRQAYLLSPWNASRLSTRTILFTSVPREYRNEERLRRIFSSVNQIWLEPNYKDLEGMVEDRDSTALKLEEAEIQLSRDANKRRLKAMKNKDTGRHGAAESDNRRWLDKKERPTHRLTPIIGKKVDTIDYCRRRLSKLLPKIDASRRTRLGGNHKLVNAVFIEFETQAAAQAAFTMVVHNKPESMVPRQIAVPPKEIVWKNLRMTAYEANVRWILATGLICAMVLFWSIPVSLVGVLSNINYLAEKVPFLRFVDNLPSSVLGVITGLLPTILLAALLALVPMIFRFLAEQTGAVTRGEIELQTQYWYFGFQIIQVFLVTTLSSGAASVASQIASNPTSVTELLARNLPKASNFYITYFVLYGVGISASYLINFGGLVTFVLGRFTANTPRAMFTDYVKLTAPRWGSEYPKWTNLGVIAITYSCIAPLVLGFATVGMGLIYGAYRYNMFFVYNTDIDTRGASYAMALQQLTVGVYLAELCLIGLFAIRLGSSLWSSGPLLLTILLLVVTILYHYLMNQALGPLVQLLPQNLLAESEVPYDATLAGAESGTPRKHSQSANSSSSEHGQADADDSQASNAQDTIAPVTINDISTLHKDRPKPSIFHRYFSPAGQSAADIAASLHPRFRRPVPPYPADVARKAYLNPVMTSEPPVLWIVHDEMGISEEEVRETGKVVRITDEGAWFDERNRVVWDKERVREMPIWKDEVVY